MNNKSFTLLELVIVIVILGILATLGYNQYSLVVEKGRTAEAIARIGVMRTFAQDYYLKNGSLIGILNAHVGADQPNNCSPDSYFMYWISGGADLCNVALRAERCRTVLGGKTPGVAEGDRYIFYQMYNACTGESVWHCFYPSRPGGPPCFGYPQ